MYSSMKRFSKIQFLFLAIPCLVFSCIDRPEFPSEPYIELKDFYILTDQQTGKDQAVIVLSFTDGEGDIGLSENDTVYPFQREGDYYNNFIMNILKKEGTDTLRLEYNLRIPPINPDEYEQPLSGEIYVEIQVDILRAVLPDNKFQFEVFIYDKALNRSNMLTSPVYLL